MNKTILLDAGPLVAYLKSSDNYNNWIINVWSGITQPLLTCEAVITEACFILRDTYGTKEAVIGLVRKGIIVIPFDLQDEANAIEQLMLRYQSVPMSLADACLVRMTELYHNAAVLTLDSDFRIYRKNRNESIDLIIPADR